MNKEFWCRVCNQKILSTAIPSDRICETCRTQTTSSDVVNAAFEIIDVEWLKLRNILALELITTDECDEVAEAAEALTAAIQGMFQVKRITKRMAETKKDQ